jgi:hypothetical protein
VLSKIGVDRHLADLPDVIVRGYACRLAARAPALADALSLPANLQSRELSAEVAFVT